MRPNEPDDAGCLYGAPAWVLQLKEAGPALMLQKPISVEDAVHTLSAARNTMVGGRLRYHRASLNLPITLECGPKQRWKQNCAT